MNKIYLIGRSARDVELESKGEVKFAKINLAVNRKFDKEKTDWFNCTAFGGLAEKVASVYIKKGTKVAITGRIEFSEVEKDDLIIRHHSVIVEDIELLDSKTNNEEIVENKLQPIDADDDLPF